MRTKSLVLSLLLASAVGATPTFANWFSNPSTNTMLNVGSAPSPTPEQLRAIGDSPYALSSYRVEARPPFDMTPLEGKVVFGEKGARLGYIIAVDNGAQMVELQTRGGMGVAVPAEFVIDKGGRVDAPTLSRADLRRMARAQTGRSVSLNL
jgi:hypothetical protein